MKANQELRDLAQASRIYLWQVASALGMNDGNFSRKLRKELPEEEKAKIRRIIADLSKKTKAVV